MPQSSWLSSLIYHMEPKREKNKVKNWKQKLTELRRHCSCESPGSQSSRSKRVYSGTGKNMQNSYASNQEWKSEEVTDDETGESTQEDDVMDVGTDESEIKILGWGWWTEAGSWFQRRGVAHVTRMNWKKKREWPQMNSKCCEEGEQWWGCADKAAWL